MNRPLLQKVHNFLSIAAKSEDGKVSKKHASKLADEVKKYMGITQEYDHDVRGTLQKQAEAELKASAPVAETSAPVTTDEVTK